MQSQIAEVVKQIEQVAAVNCMAALTVAFLFARGGDWLASYESPVSREGPGAIALRRMADGSVVAMYDVVGVNALAIAPDGATFVYSTGAGRTYLALARLPR